MENKRKKNLEVEDYRKKEGDSRVTLKQGSRVLYIFCAISLLSALLFLDTSSASHFNSSIAGDEYFTYQVLLISLCLLLSSAFFSATETAFFALKATQLKTLEQSNYYRDKLISGLMKDSANLLTTILMGNAIVNIGLSIVFGVRLERFLMERFFHGDFWGHWISYILACIVSTFILILGGEITPKLMAARYAEMYAQAVALLVFLIHLFFSPVRKLLLQVTGKIFKLTGFSSIPPSPWITDDEFVQMVKEDELSPIISEHEREMIKGILEFRDEPVKKILVPRTEIVAIPANASVKDAWDTFCEHEYSRMPVYQDSLDYIVGVLYAKDLLDYVEMNQWKVSVKPLSRKAYFIPETTSISEFIKLAQRVNTHLAVVVDEYGGTAGLVTLHDAFREIVGEITDDEKEDGPPEYIKISENEYIIDGMMAISDLEELIDYRLEDPEHATIGGFLFKIHEKITSPGDVINVGPLKFIVEKMDGNRIDKVRLIITRKESNTEDFLEEDF
ncbi:MAG: hemolysin family protein [Candidatus Hydrogenedentes bacterium]|nr:hemolysin family protein [Candidatus Hydrogenedentota bacterium]